MGFDRRLGAFGVAAAQGLVELAVLAVVGLDALGGQDLLLHAPPLGVAAHVVDLAVERQQQGIARALREQGVEMLVGVREGLAVLAGPLDAGERLGHAVEIPCRGVDRRQAGDPRLERQTNLDQLQRAGLLRHGAAVGGGAEADEGAAADPAAQQALFLEAPQRLAHGAPRGAEMGREVALGRQPGPVGVGAVHDRSAQARGDRRSAAVHRARQLRLAVRAALVARIELNHFSTFRKNWFTTGSKYGGVNRVTSTASFC